MVGRIVICILVSASVGTAYAQQVEIPRENAAKVAHQTKTAIGQPQIEARSPAVPVSYTTTASTTKPALSIEQMRQAGALAGQRVREEMHNIEEDEPPPKSTAPAKKEISANAVRAIE